MNEKITYKLTGMEEINLAMQGIRDATVQNNVGTKQMESSVQAIAKLGAELEKMDGQYKV